MSEQPRIAPRSPSEAIKPAMASPPPPRVRRPRGGLLSTLSGLFSLLAVLALAVLIGLILVSRQASEPGPLTADKVVLIPRNTGFTEISEILRREGIIEQPLLFQLYATLNGQRAHLKAGEFAFKARTSVSEAINTLAEGKSILHAFSAPEGLTSEQIVARLRENEVLTGAIDQIPPEGSLLPDTYKFERGMSRQQIIDAMQKAQAAALKQIWERRAPDLPLESPEELVVLASIVEKETGRADERTRVAGVFINRLRRNMKLQSDPTIVYGLVGGKGTLGRGILRSEIQQPTPYNTYTIDGLPPGPIANPGRAAMEAVANPSRTRDLFFVADGTGGHAFSESYEQHQRNVARWRQIERGRNADQQKEDEVDRAPEGETRGDLGADAEIQDASLGGVREVGSLPDASEGTRLDPLRNTSFDLTTPKTVPELEPLPGERPVPAARSPQTPRGQASASPPIPPPAPRRD